MNEKSFSKTIKERNDKIMKLDTKIKKLENENKFYLELLIKHKVLICKNCTKEV